MVIYVNKHNQNDKKDMFHEGNKEYRTQTVLHETTPNLIDV